MTDFWLIVATLTGPVLAVQAQKWLERYRVDRDRKEALFRTLMATRSMILHPDHVRALNSIELVFYSDAKGNVPRPRTAAAVVESWRTYFDHLHQKNESAPLVAGSPEDKQFAEKSRDLLANLLLKMAENLRYNITEREIRRGAYYPKFFTDAEEDNRIIRNGVAKMMQGELTVPLSLPGAADGMRSMLHFMAESTDTDTARCAKFALKEWDRRVGEAAEQKKDTRSNGSGL